MIYIIIIRVINLGIIIHNIFLMDRYIVLVILNFICMHEWKSYAFISKIQF